MVQSLSSINSVLSSVNSATRNSALQASARNHRADLGKQVSNPIYQHRAAQFTLKNDTTLTTNNNILDKLRHKTPNTEIYKQEQREAFQQISNSRQSAIRMHFDQLKLQKERATEQHQSQYKVKEDVLHHDEKPIAQQQIKQEKTNNTTVKRTIEAKVQEALSNLSAKNVAKQESTAHRELPTVSAKAKEVIQQAKRNDTAHLNANANKPVVSRHEEAKTVVTEQITTTKTVTNKVIQEHAQKSNEIKIDATTTAKAAQLATAIDSYNKTLETSKIESSKSLNSNDFAKPTPVTSTSTSRLF